MCGDTPITVTPGVLLPFDFENVLLFLWENRLLEAKNCHKCVDSLKQNVTERAASLDEGSKKDESGSRASATGSGSEASGLLTFAKVPRSQRFSFVLYWQILRREPLLLFVFLLPRSAEGSALRSALRVVNFQIKKIILKESLWDQGIAKGAFHYAKQTGQRSVGMRDKNGTTFSD